MLAESSQNRQAPGPHSSCDPVLKSEALQVPSILIWNSGGSKWVSVKVPSETETGGSSYNKTTSIREQSRATGLIPINKN